MLTKVFKKVMMLAGVLVAGAFVAVPVHATLPNSVSSTTVAGPNTQIPFVFLARRGESVNYVAFSTSPLCPGNTIQLEASTNMSNWTVQLATACGAPGSLGPNGVTGTLAPFYYDTFLRWNNISTGAAPIPITYIITENDDTNSATKNFRQQDSLYFNNDSLSVLGALKADRIQYQIATSSPVQVSSYTQIGWGATTPSNKITGLYALFSSNTIQVDRSLVVLVATATATQDGTGKNGVTLSASPIITTQTATNGDTIIFTSNVSSVTFTDNGTQPGSGVRLGAARRQVGVGDFLGLIFRDGFWREFLFVENQE